MTAPVEGAACRRVLVTGATGNVGREVVAALTRRGLEAHAPARPDFDLTAPATFAPALAGCDGLFLMRPPAISDVAATLHPLVDAARLAGVRLVVFLSVAGADTNRLVPHHKTERYLRAGSVPWTFLRPGFFAQNLGDAYRRDLVEDDRLFVPSGRGQVAWVDVRDVAEVAVNAFAAPAAHAGTGYPLTGPEAVGFAEVAALLTAALGRPIRYQPASILAYVRHLRRDRDQPWMQAIIQTVLHVELRRADARRVDPTLARLLGRSPRTIADYVRDHAALWAR